MEQRFVITVITIDNHTRNYNFNTLVDAQKGYEAFIKSRGASRVTMYIELANSGLIQKLNHVASMQPHRSWSRE